MSYHFLKYVREGKDGREIYQDRLRYEKTELAPVISEDTMKYHHDGLAAKYFERYNAGEGDADFNYGGAILHNIYFGNLTPPRAGNRPDGASLALIEDQHGSFDKFKEAFEREFMAAQGSNWIYMSTDGKIHTIHNHQYKDSMKIALLVDAWEHAWALDYQQDKAKYLANIWRIIDWDVVNIRIGV